MQYNENQGWTNISFGKSGEEIAKKFLIEIGYKITHSNFRTPFGEIDIIAKDGNVIVFVEVKTRSSSNYGSPLFSITDYKKRNIIKNATYFLYRYRLLDRDSRIDVIAINTDCNGNFEKLEHIKSAIWVE